MKRYKLLGLFCFLSLILSLMVAGCSSLYGANPTPTPEPTRDPVLEQTIEKQLASMNPDALPIYREATKALDADEYEKSRDLYNQVTDLAPNFATAYRRLGYIESALENPQGAIKLIRKAVELEPDGYNKNALAAALLYGQNKSDYPEALDLASSAAKLLPEDESSLTTWLLAAVATEDETNMRQADEQLLKVAPNNLYAHYYAGFLAAVDGKWERSEKEFLIAQKLGLPEEDLQRILSTGISRYAMMYRLFRGGGIATGVWLLGLGAFFVVGKSLSSATINTLKTSRPTLETQIQPGELRIRSIYRKVISLLSIYYYISIPFVVLLLLLVIGVAVYIFGQIGSIPVQAIYILAVMLLGSLYAIVRSLLSRHKEIPVGRPLQKMDAPELWRLVEDVARTVSVRPVDAVYITPGIEIAVNEKGSILGKMRGTSKRNLLLGLGVLPALTQGQLIAILAHEYGHFSNRDTAGGNLAFQVHTSLYAMVQRLIQSKAAFFFNPVWLFVVTYQRLFLQVTQGASRLQEILADRYAAKTYGGTNFIEGLRNLIHQSIAFPMQVNYEIREASEHHRPTLNFYNLPMPEKLTTEVNQQFEEAMQRTTSEYDSHPAPKERISWIEALNVPYSPIHDNSRPALELFPNTEELQREMTELINHSVGK